MDPGGAAFSLRRHIGYHRSMKQPAGESPLSPEAVTSDGLLPARALTPAYHSRQERLYRLVAPLYDRLVWPRMRPVVETAVALLGPLTGCRVLDGGTGTGNLAFELARAGAEVTGLDLSPSLLRMARRKPGAAQITWVHGDVTALPFGASAFAYSSAAMMLHELPEPLRDRALAELTRVSGCGLVVIDYQRRAPIRRATLWLEALEGSNYRSYVRYPLEDQLERLGWAITEGRHLGQFEILLARPRPGPQVGTQQRAQQGFGYSDSE